MSLQSVCKLLSSKPRRLVVNEALLERKGTHRAYQSVCQLREVGLDLTFLLEHLFIPASKEAVISYTEHQRESIIAEVRKDDFGPAQVNSDVAKEAAATPTPAEERTSGSLLLFQAIASRFLADVSLLGTITLYDVILRSFASVIATYVAAVGAKVSERSMTDAQVRRRKRKSQRTVFMCCTRKLTPPCFPVVRCYLQLLAPTKLSKRRF